MEEWRRALDWLHRCRRLVALAATLAVSGIEVFQGSAHKPKRMGSRRGLPGRRARTAVWQGTNLRLAPCEQQPGLRALGVRHPRLAGVGGCRRSLVDARRVRHSSRVYHRVSFLQQYHDAHHAKPRAYLGAGMGTSLIVLVTFLPTSVIAPISANGALIMIESSQAQLWPCRLLQPQALRGISNGFMGRVSVSVT